HRRDDPLRGARGELVELGLPRGSALGGLGLGDELLALGHAQLHDFLLGRCCVNPYSITNVPAGGPGVDRQLLATLALPGEAEVHVPRHRHVTPRSSHSRVRKSIIRPRISPGTATSY